MTVAMLAAAGMSAYADTSAGAAAAADIVLGSGRAVYGIDAVYDVSAPDTGGSAGLTVESVDATFRNGLGFAQYNYENGKLYIAIASAQAVDLSSSLASVTAKLSDGSAVAPRLTLTLLQYNGVPAVNAVIGSADAVKNGNDVDVIVKLRDVYGTTSVKAITAVYDASGRMLKSVTDDVDISNNDVNGAAADATATDGSGEVTLKTSLTGCSKNAATVKIFLTDANYIPLSSGAANAIASA